MTTPKRLLRRQVLSGCSELGSDDGTDPRDWKKDWNARRPGRKSLQLCRQVSEALGSALASCADAVLQDLLVVSVEPAPNAGRLLVTVATAPSAAEHEAVTVTEHLHRAAGWLRSEVAASIHRRKTPELTYRVTAE